MGKSRLITGTAWLGLVASLLAACGGPAQPPLPALTAQPAVATLTVTASVLPSATLTHTPTPPPPLPTEVPLTAEAVPTDILAPSSTPTASPVPLPTATPTYDPQAWQQEPVIPVVSASMAEVYRRGLAQGRDAHSFSKIGDCETQTEYFLIDFDLGQRAYSLGPYGALQGVIDQFAGSWKRSSLAAKRGFTAASAFAVFESDPKQCQGNETPLACEYRLGKPSLALIMLGTNDALYRKKSFETYLRQIIDFTLAQGVVPILATKADNLEGDNSINQTIARLAHEYQVPLWNFWQAVKPLPDHGLQQDGTHLTFAKNHFDDPAALQAAWPIRNLTALQVLDAVWRSVSGQ